MKLISLTALVFTSLLLGVYLRNNQQKGSLTSFTVVPRQEDYVMKQKIEANLQNCQTPPQVLEVLRIHGFADIDDYSYNGKRTISAVRIPTDLKGHNEEDVVPRAIGVTVQFVGSKRSELIVHVGVRTE